MANFLSNLLGKQPISVWDGRSETQPKKGEFIYKNQKYLIQKLGQHYYVVNQCTKKPYLVLSIRMFGGRTGSTIPDLIVKSGTATKEELADIFEREDQKTLVALMLKFAETAISQPNVYAWIIQKKITIRELENMDEQLTKMMVGILLSL